MYIHCINLHKICQLEMGIDQLEFIALFDTIIYKENERIHNTNR